MLLLHGRSSAPLTLLTTSVFPGATVPHRRVQQIDLVPSLVLLPGIPVPYNNLGTVILELFGCYGQLEHALELNVKQVKAVSEHVSRQLLRRRARRCLGCPARVLCCHTEHTGRRDTVDGHGGVH
ncbi:hypothetical protein C8Q72DRAFT_851036, partial [Fomitopsis betulina]